MTMHVRCPYCEHKRTVVEGGRAHYRTRRCHKCERTFTTREIVVGEVPKDMPRIRKHPFSTVLAVRADWDAGLSLPQLEAKYQISPNTLNEWIYRRHRKTR